MLLRAQEGCRPLSYKLGTHSLARSQGFQNIPWSQRNTAGETTRPHTFGPLREETESFRGHDRISLGLLEDGVHILWVGSTTSQRAAAGLVIWVIKRGPRPRRHCL